MAETTSPAKVVLLGFDERTRETMRLIFEGPGKRAYALSAEETAQIGVINLDSVDGRSLWAGLRQRHPGISIILMAARDPGAADALFLAKPVSQQQLLEALQRLADERRRSAAVTMRAAAGAAVAESAAPSPQKAPGQGAAASEDAFYDPQQYLQGELQRLLVSARRWEITIGLHVTMGETTHGIFLMPALNRIVHRLGTTQLAQLCGTPAFMLKIVPRHYTPDESLSLELDARQKGAGEAIDSFLWRVARYTSHGRLPIGTSLASPAHIAHWPNFTRLPANASAMRITALLVEQPRPLPLVAKVLNIPLKEVCSFYSAAHAIGAAGVHARIREGLPEPETPPRHQQHRVFGQMLNRLKEIGGTAER